VLGSGGGESDEMTYCVGVLLKGGIIFASDSRTNAGVDNFATFCKMSVFERAGDRVIVLLSSGSLAGTQAVVSVLRQRCENSAHVEPGPSESVEQGARGSKSTGTLWGARTMFDVAMLVSDATREVEERDGKYLEKGALAFNASFIIGGQIRGEPMRLFRTFAEGNFIEASSDTPFFQTGEAKYGKPIIDRVITPDTNLADAAKCVLLSFDSTMRSNLSVGMPIDVLRYHRDDLEVGQRWRFEPGNAYFTSLSAQWSHGVRKVFTELPDLPGSGNTAA
jgi:putative proteasome-type protease